MGGCVSGRGYKESEDDSRRKDMNEDGERG